MFGQYQFRKILIASVVILGSSYDSARGVAAPPESAGAEKGVEVLVRGPVHEAFAGTVTYDPQPGIIIPKMPPEAIEELPPNLKPEGDNVTWIPGYWTWDEDRTDFLWVSGIWRAVPPGRQWLPGYWSASGQGSQWTSGYWADAKLGEVQYLPEPPATVEAGPIGTAPSANHLWIPGSWAWNQNRYVWQPGYWSAAQENWAWTPSHYQWTPRGYVSVAGYYDYSLARRGVLFAPVYLSPSVYSQQGYVYSPSVAISLAVFANQLFLRPQYGHYYFGDYYGANYSGAGYYPWFAFNSGGYGYDPFYAQQNWQNRQNPGWSKSLQSDFQNRVDNQSARPPRTLADQQTLAQSGTSTAKNIAVATPLDQLAKSKDSTLRLQKVTEGQQQTIAKHRQAVQEFRDERQKREAVGTEAASVKGKEATGVKISKSPIMGTASDQLAKEHTPPQAHEAPKSDPNVEPKARQAAKPADPKSTPIKAAKPALPEEKPATPDQKPKVKPVPNAGEKPATIPPKTVPETTPKVPSRITPRTGPAPEAPRPDVKPIPKAEPKVEPKAEPKVEPKFVPRTAPKAELKPEPKAPAKVETAPEAAKPEPRDKPRK